MQIDSKQIAGEPRQLGTLGSKKVMHLKTKGGYHVIYTLNSDRRETLGVGLHVGVAKHIASRRHPGIIWDALKKSEHLDPRFLAEVLPRWEQITEAICGRE